MGGIAMGRGIDSWRLARDYTRNRQETCANIVILLFLLVCAFLVLINDPVVTPSNSAPRTLACSHGKKVASQYKVSGPTGANSALSIFIGRSGLRQVRDVSPLEIQGGKLTPVAQLCMAPSDFVRSDGQVLPAAQVASDAVVSNDGRDTEVRVAVAPRYLLVSGFGEYTGRVSLDDSRAVGAVVPVKLYVEYPYVYRAFLLGLLAAAGGMFWALLVRKADLGSKVRDLGQQEQEQQRGESALFWPSLALRIAVLATSVPIVNAQVASSPGWTGSLSEYIKLGTIAGAAAIATTPTLSVIVSRVKRSNH